MFRKVFRIPNSNSKFQIDTIVCHKFATLSFSAWFQAISSTLKLGTRASLLPRHCCRRFISPPPHYRELRSLENGAFVNMQVTPIDTRCIRYIRPHRVVNSTVTSVVTFRTPCTECGSTSACLARISKHPVYTRKSESPKNRPSLNF